MSVINYILGCVFAVLSTGNGFPVEASWVDLLVGTIAIFLPIAIIIGITTVIAISKKKARAKKIKNGEIKPPRDFINK